MTKKQKLAKIQFLPVDRIMEERFSFVQDELLRENLAINTQYVSFLYDLEEEYELTGIATYAIFRDIVIHAASIIEGLVTYRLHDLVSNEPKSNNLKNIQKKILSEFIVGANFFKLNQAAKKCGLFDSALCKDADKLREMRNAIHPSAQKESDRDDFSKKEIDKVFSTVAKIIDRIKDFDGRDDDTA